MDKDRADDQNMLDYVLDFYAGKGTPLSFRPRLKYLPTQPDDPTFRAWACVEAPQTSMEAASQYLQQGLFEQIFLEGFRKHNLQVSQEALVADITKLAPAKQPQQWTRKHPDADILIYPHFTAQAADLREEILAHEIWHLIEGERGHKRSHPLLIEGTATYAQKRFAGKAPSDYTVRWDDSEPIASIMRKHFHGIMYFGLPRTIHRHVGSEQNPYQAMLDPERRDAMQKDCAKTTQKVLYRLAETVAQTPQGKQQIIKGREAMLQNLGTLRQLSLP